MRRTTARRAVREPGRVVGTIRPLEEAAGVKKGPFDFPRGVYQLPLSGSGIRQWIAITSRGHGHMCDSEEAGLEYIATKDTPLLEEPHRNRVGVDVKRYTDEGYEWREAQVEVVTASGVVFVDLCETMEREMGMYHLCIAADGPGRKGSLMGFELRLEEVDGIINALVALRARVVVERFSN